MLIVSRRFRATYDVILMRKAPGRHLRSLSSLPTSRAREIRTEHHSTLATIKLNRYLDTMSSNTYSTFQSSSYSSYSDSSGNRYEESSYSDPSGTTTKRTTQKDGQNAVTESEHIPNNRLEQKDGDQRRIEDVTDEPEETEADKQYADKMEDEYAKREGGA